MHASMVGKIQKAKFYAAERERITFEDFNVKIRGDNSEHTVSFRNGEWHCDCEYFQIHAVCSHTMALERVLEEMI
ncbi:MAG: hypothetical protein GYB64_03505 [Chloroflexi bacterium]|nr:hypothetical protein [Chloroflexota bacterium]